MPAGLVVNPASGKDIRRLTGKASVFDNREKLAIVKRALAGAVSGGLSHLYYMDDAHGIAHTAIAESALPRSIKVERIPTPKTSSALDTLAAAEAFAQTDCNVVMTLGGDGTNRAFVKGWRDANLIPLSTGTNNVFPVLEEATIAGMALGLMSQGKRSMGRFIQRRKVIELDLGSETDIALIDAVMTSDQFIGARALLDPSSLKAALLCRADPAGVGMTSLGGLLAPVSDDEDAGLLVEFGEGGKTLTAPMIPGKMSDIPIASCRRVGLDRTITFEGPCALALDGEREHVLTEDARLSMRVSREGPGVVDIGGVLAAAAKNKWFLK